MLYSDKMDRIIETSLLLDFYGQLLTQRQQEILDLYCNGDLSLGEIAENLNISRQGVYDNIKRGRAVLYELEAKLGLAAKFAEQKSKLQKIIKELKNITPAKNSETAMSKLISDLEELESEI